MADFSGRIRRIRIREEQGGTSFKTIVVVVGDVNNQVATVDVKFSNPKQVPTPIPTSMSASFVKYVPEKELSRFAYKQLTFKEGAMPIGTKYTMTAQMKAADGSNLGGVFEETVVVEDKNSGEEDDTGGDPNAEFKGRIHRIRIREEQGGTSFKVVVVVTGDANNQQVATVKCVFNPTENPTPIPTSMTCKLVSVNKDKDSSRYLFKPLTFKDGAMPLEDIYNMTAVMLAKDGTTLGEPLTSDVIVESNDCNE